MQLVLAVSSMALPSSPAAASTASVEPVPVELKPLSPASSDWSSQELQHQLNTLKNYAAQPKIPYQLEEALAQAIEASPQLAIAYRSIQRQEWDLIAARRQWYPQLSVSAQPLVGFTSGSNQYYYNDVPPAVSSSVPFASVFEAVTDTGIPVVGDMQGAFGLAGEQQPSFSGTYNNGLQIAPTTTLSWSFFDLPRDSTINSQIELVQQQKLLFDVSARGLILDVEQNYYSLQSLAQLISAYIKLSQENINEVAIMEQRLTVRLATVADVEQSKSQALLQLNQLISNLFQYAQSSSTLAQLLGLTTEKQIQATDRFDASQRWPLTLKQTIEHGLQTREEIYASLARAKSFDWEARALMQRYIPTLFLFGTGSLNFNQGNLSRSLGSASSGPTAGTFRNPTSTVGLGLSWDLFDGGIRAAQSESMRYQAQQQRDQAQQNRLTVIQQIKTAFAGYQTQYQALLNSNASVASALKAQDAARARYQVGIGDITTLVQATSLYGQALTNQANAQMNYSTSIADLFRYSAIWPLDTQAQTLNREEVLR